MAAAVSLDVANAFNSLLWTVIKRTMRRKVFPNYIIRIVDSYLHNKCLLYTGQDRSLHRGPITCGVLQGSVLGSKTSRLMRCSRLDFPDTRLYCYADDTLVVLCRLLLLLLSSVLLSFCSALGWPLLFEGESWYSASLLYFIFLSYSASLYSASFLMRLNPVGGKQRGMCCLGVEVVSREWFEWAGRVGWVWRGLLLGSSARNLHYYSWALVSGLVPGT